jgi:hypothetical protein
MIATTYRSFADSSAHDVPSDVATAINHLLDICDRDEAQPVSMFVAVEQSPLRFSSLANILRAFRVLFFSDGDLNGVHHATRCALETYGSPRQVLDAILEVQDEMPHDIAGLIEASLHDQSTLRSLVRTTYLFGLREDVYDELGIAIPYRQYRQRCIEKAVWAFSTAQYELAKVLADDWRGPIETLTATVRLLCPSEDQAPPAHTVAPSN